MLPEQEYLNECFRYDSESGDLFWKKRPQHHFVNSKIKKTNKLNNKKINNKELQLNGVRYRTLHVIYKMLFNYDAIKEKKQIRLIDEKGPNTIINTRIVENPSARNKNKIKAEKKIEDIEIKNARSLVSNDYKFKTYYEAYCYAEGMRNGS